jgi:hypothetical protein
VFFTLNIEIHYVLRGRCTCQLKYFFLDQVMALIAYLMEFKGNYGPHLIIVPNAVLVNWKVSFKSFVSTIFLIFVIKCAFNPENCIDHAE